MFDKILIANRGEIAGRIIRTCQRMGVRTVAVYSDADAGALHVRQADEAVRIGPAPAVDSYLRGDVIIAAARATGAQAIHPGYGFLSENPEFVEAVAAAGLVFIGPSASAIRAMGLKDAAKARMARAGVPVVPGYHGADQTQLAERAAEIGYPVLIKAVAGGGGKGMRLVEDPARFAEALGFAQAEARAAFGNPAVLIERYVTAPRHIEVQVFGDGLRAVHLFERDCSLQRRHQKVIEEAPAPGMTAQMRAAMGQAAVRAAESIGYAGAGTVEFIVDGSGPLSPDRFWFMEMNTRLQVEHPVTEAITGVDLVEWQLRVAAGEPLPLRQADLGINGHAFEARLYAEDVPAGFLPATGRLTHLAFPATARADTGVSVGDEITAWYDPMIAKLIVHAPDRSRALGRLAETLEQTQVAGLVTNLPLLRALCHHAGFADGAVDTGLIARDIAQLTALAPVPPRHLAQAVLALMGLDGPPDPFAGFALWAPGAQHLPLIVRSADHLAAVQILAPDRIAVTIAGDRVECCYIGGGWRFDGAAPVPLCREGRRVTLFETCDIIETPDPCARIVAPLPPGDTILAPMPGIVRSVDVGLGQAVQPGDRVAVIEAMKMEHVLRAPRAGIIAQIAARPGDQIDLKALVASLEPLA